MWSSEWWNDEETKGESHVSSEWWDDEERLGGIVQLPEAGGRIFHSLSGSEWTLHVGLS